MEQRLQAEKLGHLRHPKPDGLLIQPQVLQAEGQLMPHLIRDNLAVRVLHHVTDPGTLIPETELLHRRPVQG